MAAFPSIAPTYPLRLRRQPKVKVAQFGDGYAMRQPDGINNDLRTYEVTFARVPETDRDAIDTFLSDQKGSIPFDWTPPGDSAGKWICENWDIEYPEYNQFTIKATFVEFVP